MFLFNVVLVLALLAFVGLGLKDGFIVGMGRVFGTVVGFLAARAWYAAVAKMLFFLPDSWAKIVAFMLIFVLVTRILGWIFSALDKTYKFLAKLPFMKSANSLLGGVLGFVEGLVIIGGAVWFVRVFSIPAFLVNYANNSGVASWVFWSFNKLLWIIL